MQILMVKLFLLLQYETSALYSFSPYAWSTYYMQGYFRDFIEIKMRDSCCKAGTEQNPTGLSHFLKYKTNKFTIRTTALQTQHLMHVLELLYSYHNCHQRGKKLTVWCQTAALPEAPPSVSRSTESVVSMIPRTDLKGTKWTWLPVVVSVFVGINIIAVYPAHIWEQATKTVRKETLTSSTLEHYVDMKKFQKTDLPL